jgi:hypothetical protein
MPFPTTQSCASGVVFQQPASKTPLIPCSSYTGELKITLLR